MLILVAAALSAPDVTVVLLNPNDVLAPAVERASRAETFDERRVQTSDDILNAITGLEDPRMPSAAGLGELLEGAERMFQTFQSEQGFQLLDNVVRTYDRGAVLSAEIMKVAAAATHSMAAERLASSRSEALKSAVESIRRFPDVPVDSLKHSPVILRLFKQARAQVEELPTERLLITTSAPGDVYVDGHNLGAIKTRISVNLPHGDYKVWIETANGTSFAHSVSIRSGEDSAVFIETALESHLALQPRIALSCESEAICAERLAALAKSAGTGLAVGLDTHDHQPSALYVNQDGKTEWRTLDYTIPSPRNEQPFSPYYLVPFGVGQMAQERYLTGGIYAAVQLGLLAWNIQATAARDDASQRDPTDNSLDGRQNLSAGLFYGAVAASIIESVVYWAMD